MKQGADRPWDEHVELENGEQDLICCWADQAEHVVVVLAEGAEDFAEALLVPAAFVLFRGAIAHIGAAGADAEDIGAPLCSVSALVHQAGVAPAESELPLASDPKLPERVCSGPLAHRKNDSNLSNTLEIGILLDVFASGERP
ncbi:hypothetical protein ACFW0H_01230 [Pseudomonas sp. CR3202]|uniref:hypothetical protein n=1 Tax=Pseudomonas sp. CR3202 TaxID=3351532 RepID=UPI003BF1D03E